MYHPLSVGGERERGNCLFYRVEPLLKISWGVEEEAFECPEKEEKEIGT